MTVKVGFEGYRLRLLSSLLLSLLAAYSLQRTEGRALIDRDLDQALESSPFGDTTPESSYRIYLFLAQEDAKCLRHYGGVGNEAAGEESVKNKEAGEESKDATPSRKGPFTNYRCVETLSSYAQCEQCRNLVERIPTTSQCQAICGSDSVCSAKCLDLVARVEELRKPLGLGEVSGAENLKMAAKGLTLSPPELLCEDMSRVTDEKQFHAVVLKWALTFEVPTNDSGSTVDPNTPIVFVLQVMDVNAMFPQWETRGKTLSRIQRVNTAYHSVTYRYRVTALGPEGPLARSVSAEIKTLEAFPEELPPIEIFEIKQVVHEDDDKIDILVGWTPPPDKPCAYKVIKSRNDGDGESVLYRPTFSDLENGLQAWFYDLKLKQKYEVRITSRRANRASESGIRSKIFTMPECLEAHHNRFDKCAPTRPQRITQDPVVIVKEADGEGTGQVKVKWDPPLHTSPTNPLKSYTLIVGKPDDMKRMNSTMAVHSAFGMAALTRSERTILINGDVTEYVIPDLTLNRVYPIAIIATSSIGDSTPLPGEILTSIVSEEEESLVTSWIYLSIPISLMILGIFGCHFLRVLVQKRQVKQARNQYFQSMDERDAMSPDWSIVPLHDDSPTLKFLSEGPREKWEISYDNLIMGEVIGQGAFGVVRRAKMTRRKNPIGNGPKYSVLSENAELDENGMETVAVKMLKVSATRDDRDQLIKEIVTMQHLGAHPQIVSLLGACTKGRSLCLVLEFCPGGDLLSFLRKVRAKYWPTLGLSNNGKSWSDRSSEKTTLLKNTTSLESGCNSDDSFNSNNSHKSRDASPINYADMVTSNESSLSRSKVTSPTDTVINHQYGKVPAPEPEDECRPIDEKDILSYARQIAMGMEFLEKNRVVHRDLAGRNVLLLGDFKQVKISDFGLSRDIYTWNVYHQKSNGKLPIKWMAIESIFTHVFTSKSDVWSFGILLWELVTLGGTPYPGLGNTELFHLLKSGYRMERPDNCSEEIYALMKKCWRTSPVSRPNFTELRRFLETMLEAAEPSLYLSLMADIPVDYFHISSRSDLLHLKLEDDSPLRDTSGGAYAPSTNRHYNFNTAPGNNNVNNPYGSAPKKLRTKNILLESRSPTMTPSVPDLPSAAATSLLLGNRPETSSSTTAIGNLVKDSGSSPGPLLPQGHVRSSPVPVRSHPTFKRTRSRSLRSNESSTTRLPINDSLHELKRSPKFGGSSESLVSPDSGLHRSESEAGGGCTMDDDPWSDPEDFSLSTPLRRPMTLDLDTPKVQISIPLKNLNSMTVTENRTFMG